LRSPEIPKEELARTGKEKAGGTTQVEEEAYMGGEKLLEGLLDTPSKNRTNGGSLALQRVREENDTGV